MVVRWTLRAGGLGGEMGLHHGGILGKFQYWNLPGALAQWPNVAFSTVSLPWPLQISALTKRALVMTVIKNPNLMTPCSCQVLSSIAYGSLQSFSSISENVGARKG